MPNETENNEIKPEEVKVEVEETNEQKIEKLELARKARIDEDKQKDAEVIAMIANATGRQLWSFMGKLKRSIGGGGNNSRYLKLCTARAHELNKDRYGNWEFAKVELNHLPEPTGMFESQSLLPILGYPCEYIVTKEKGMVVMINPKLNIAYVKDTGYNIMRKSAEIFK